MIVAPAAQTALALQMAAAREGTGLVNVETVSVNGVALHVWRSMHPASAARLVSQEVMTLVLAHALEQSRLSEADLLRTSLPALARAIASDRMAGRTAEWAATQARSASQRVYASLFEAYEAYLLAEGRLDLADVHREALASLGQFGQERALDLLLLCSDAELLPVQEQLMRGLASRARRAVLLPAFRPDPQRHPCTAGVLFTDWEGAEVQPPDPPVGGRVLQAASRREEVWLVLQDILERQIPFDDVELASTSPETYVPLISAACERLQVPTTLRQPADSEPAWRRAALSRYLRWIASGYDAMHLADLLRLDHVRVPPEGPSAATLARMLDHFRLRPAHLSRPELIDAIREGAGRHRIPVREALALVDWLHGFRTWAPDANLPPARYARMISGCLAALFPDAPGQEEEQEYLDRLLEPLKARGLRPVDVRLLAEGLLERMLVPTETGRDTGNGIHVVPLQLAGAGSRRYVWVLGLDDQAAAGSPPDGSRHPMGLETALPEGFGNGLSVRERVADLAARIRDGLTLCVPAWDVSASRALFPSSALVERVQLEKIRPLRRHQGLDAADAFRRNPWSADAAFPDARNGLEGMALRHAPFWTDHDGRVGAGPSDHGSPVALRMSPSRVETFLACPYRYFLSHVLGLDPEDRVGEEWIDAAAEGNILHDLFEQHTRQRIAGEAGIDAAEEERMLEALRSALARQVIRSGEAADPLIASRVRMLSHAVRQYFQRERQLEGERRPVHAEYSFSDHPDADAPEVRYRNERGELVLTGRIDRIDALHDGRWVIVDYKSGKPEAFLPEDLAKLDGKLQWALYAWAASRAAGKEVASSEYVFTSRMGAGWVSRIAAPAEAQVSPLLDQVLERALTGHFIPAPQKEGTCTWCDFKAVCGDLDARRQAILDKFATDDPSLTEVYEGWAFRTQAMKK
ncbi:MAG: PD-(D/E)XK nuclease family protein [Bacteroidetes bacterium]|nr:PD-(D/E)XK nuclease family protein [Bacteroidota bacterium]